MYAIQRPKFIITIGEHFSPDKPIHKQVAKFYSIKFEGKVYEIRFFSKSMHWNLKNPRKNSGRQPLHGAFKSRRLRVKETNRLKHVQRVTQYMYGYFNSSGIFYTLPCQCLELLRYDTCVAYASAASSYKHLLWHTPTSGYSYFNRKEQQPTLHINFIYYK